MSDYDSTVDTLLHIKRVDHLLKAVAAEFLYRGSVHDNSKLQSPEKELFDEMTPKLKGSTYGSEEYVEMLAKLKPALDHHYAHNRHHPEYYPNGITDMTLFDLIEMLVDWKAAGERHANGNMNDSLRINRKRFNISDEMYLILCHTATLMENIGDE